MEDSMVLRKRITLIVICVLSRRRICSRTNARRGGTTPISYPRCSGEAVVRFRGPSARLWSTPAGSLGRKLLIDGNVSAASAISPNGGEPEAERRFELSFL